ncbi:hypothetical protein GCM10009127_18370 [Alteraurantiacibacter aestuarii]|uniref:lipopolysaccharide biosynthesis protein n=1 Tax=Alteraurantiacibacter aestuarii TaxID=650004 RepID=UPI0031D4F003
MTDNKKDVPGGATRSHSHSLIESSISSGALILITLLTGVLLSRLLGPEGRGQYGSAIFWSNFAGTFLTFSLYEAALLKIRARRENGAGFLPSLLTLSGMLSLLAIALGPILVLTGVVKVEGIDSWVLLVFLVTNFILVVGQNAFGTVELSNLRFIMVNIERAVTPFLMMLCIVVLFLLDVADLPLLLLLFVACRLPNFVPRIYRYRHHLIGKVDTGFLKETGRLGWRMNLSHAAMGLAGEADRLVIVPLWSAQMLGYYFAAMSTCGASLAIVGQAIEVTLLPTLTGLGLDEKRRKIEQMFRFAVIMGLGMGVALSLAAPFLVPLVFGEAFTPAVYYVQGLIFASMIKPIISILSISHFSEQKMMPGIYTAGAFVTVFLTGFLITGFDHLPEFFVVLGLANLASLLTSLTLLVRAGLIRIGQEIVPGPADVVLLTTSLWHYGMQIVRRKR